MAGVQDKYAAFLSYARADDSSGEITNFHAALQNALRQHLYGDARIFIDKEKSTGHKWHDMLVEQLGEVDFFIAMVTPNFLRSGRCREEFEVFVRESRRGKLKGRVVPVLTIECDEFAGSEFYEELRTRNFADFREVRFEDPSSKEYRKFIDKIALDMKRSPLGEGAPSKAAKPSRTADKAIDPSDKSRRLSGVERKVAKCGRIVRTGLALIRKIRPAVRSLAASTSDAEPTAETTSEQPASLDPQTSDSRYGAREVPGGRVDNVHFSVTSPPSVRPGEHFLLTVWAHPEGQRRMVIERARDTKQEGPIAVQTVGPRRLVRGIALTVRVDLQDLLVDPTEDIILWDGEIGNAIFPVQVPPEVVQGVRIGSARIFADGFLIVRVSFQLVVSDKRSDPAGLDVRERAIRTAFASYSSKDLPEVAGRIHGLLKGAPWIEIFWDRHSLRSGEPWEAVIKQAVTDCDVFYLFWSRAASQSRHVDMEWRLALKIRGIEYINPFPLASAADVPPPPELKEKHFNDWVLPYTRAPVQDTPTA